MSLLSRYISLVLLLAVTACAGGPAKRVNEPAGPLSAKARNRLAQEDPEALVRAAMSFEQGGQYAGAFDLYSQALAANPELLAAARGRARVTALGGRVENGLNMLRALYADYPADAGVRRDYVATLLRAVKLDEAYGVLNAVAPKSDLSITEFYQLGILQEIRGDSVAARRTFDKAASLAPEDFRSQRFLALSFALAGNYRPAIALLQEGVNHPSTQEIATQSLADVYALSGQLQAALEIAETVYSYAAVQEKQAIYRLLPALDRPAKATLLMLGKLPPDVARAIYGD